MARFLVGRLVAGALTILVIASLSFFVCRFAPGSPFSTEKNVPAEVRRNMEKKYGLDRPLHEQYLRVMGGYLRGDLGPSYQYTGRDVSEFVVPGFLVSIRLGAIGFVIAMLLGVSLGVVSSANQNRWPDHAAASASTLGICVPNFLLGPLLVLLFHNALGWFEPTGWPQDWGSPAELRKLLLPAVTLALVHVAYLSRLTRAGMLDVLNKDFIRTARAKGLSPSTVVLRHGLKNGITPALTYAGPMAAGIVTGSIVVEKIFAIPGLGTYFVNSAFNRDYSLLMGSILIYSTMLILLNLLVDLLYGVLDPRVRVS